MLLRLFGVFVAYCLFSGWISLAFVVLDTCLVVVLVAVLRFGCWFIVGLLWLLRSGGFGGFDLVIVWFSDDV